MSEHSKDENVTVDAVILDVRKCSVSTARISVSTIMNRRRKSGSAAGVGVDHEAVARSGVEWAPPPGLKKIPSPARAAELEAEVG